MSRGVAERFVEALRTLEDERDVEPLVEVHTEDCEVGNVSVPKTFTGHEGLREFWTSYRNTLRRDEVHIPQRPRRGGQGGAGVDYRRRLRWRSLLDGVSILRSGGEGQEVYGLLRSPPAFPQVAD